MITPERINNYVNGLNEIRIHLLKSKGELNTQVHRDIAAKYSMSRDVLTRAITLKYFERLDRAKYKCLVGNIEPIHARKILELTSQLVKESLIKNKQKEIKKPLVSPVASIKLKKSKNKSLTTSKIIEQKQEKRTVSILWGLFSWTKN